MSQPTPEQLAAVLAFRARHGRYWKMALRDCWEKNRYALRPDDESTSLHQVRNEFGPKWLVTFRPKP